MRLTTWTTVAAVLIGLALGGGEALAKKGGGGKPGGGGGGDPPNTTPLDILYTVPEGSGYGTLYAMQDDGTGAVAVTDTRGAASWSPDGTQVAFYGVQSGFGVYVMDVDGGTPQKLIAIENFTAGWLDWCPVAEADGTHKLAFTSRDDSGTGNADLYVARFDDSGLIDSERLTSSTGNESRPTWSPSGEQIAIAYHQQIRVLDLADRDASGIPSVHVLYDSTQKWPQHVAWAKTSNQLAFTAADDQAHPLNDVFVMQLSHSNGVWTGSSAVNITNSPKDDESDPTWSPDDSQLAVFDVYWRRGAGNGKATSSLQLLTRATGARQTLSSTGVTPVWRRSTP